MGGHLSQDVGVMGAHGCWMGTAACPVPLPALPYCVGWIWGWHRWLWSELGVQMGPEKTPLGAGVEVEVCTRVRLSVRPKLQTELNWKERREARGGSFAEMLPDRYSVETAAAGCRCSEIHKY